MNAFVPLTQSTVLCSKDGQKRNRLHTITGAPNGKNKERSRSPTSVASEATGVVSIAWHQLSDHGTGDGGKSTVLDAIDLCLGARAKCPDFDADFFSLDITAPISITLTLGSMTA